jgi:hypothetical protein
VSAQRHVFARITFRHQTSCAQQTKHTMSGAGPSLHTPDFPSWSVFKFPPDSAPAPITNPYSEVATFSNPFHIPQDIFEGALGYKVPLAIASVYAVTVTYLNWYNRQHGNKPWKISKTRPFFAFVIFHNVFLAVYSAITCVAMIRALKHSFPHYSDPNAVVGTVDALCKINGPRGLGDAVTYNATTNTWASKNSNILVDSTTGLPDQTDVGRIWNEGLAFWGWWFYLSKFYEVLDTVIILVKGKRSTEVPPCRRYAVHVGWYALHGPSHLDVRSGQLWYSRHDGK